jgi:hypothetical protein
MALALAVQLRPAVEVPSAHALQARAEAPALALWRARGAATGFCGQGRAPAARGHAQERETYGGGADSGCDCGCDCDCGRVGGQQSVRPRVPLRRRRCGWGARSGHACGCGCWPGSPGGRPAIPPPSWPRAAGRHSPHRSRGRRVGGPAAPLPESHAGCPGPAHAPAHHISGHLPTSGAHTHTHTRLSPCACVRLCEARVWGVRRHVRRCARAKRPPQSALPPVPAPARAAACADATGTRHRPPLGAPIRASWTHARTATEGGAAVRLCIRGVPTAADEGADGDDASSGRPVPPLRRNGFNSFVNTGVYKASLTYTYMETDRHAHAHTQTHTRRGESHARRVCVSRGAGCPGAAYLEFFHLAGFFARIGGQVCHRPCGRCHHPAIARRQRHGRRRDVGRRRQPRLAGARESERETESR